MAKNKPSQPQTSTNKNSEKSIQGINRDILLGISFIEGPLL